METAILEKLKTNVLNPTIIDGIKNRAERIIQAAFLKKQTSPKQLLRKKTEIQKKIDNLLTQIENGDISEVVSDRIKHREAELKRINLEIERSKYSPEQVSNITIDWIIQKLENLKEMISGKQDRTILLRNELRNLFPNKIKSRIHRIRKFIGISYSRKGQPLQFIAGRKCAKNIYVPKGTRPFIAY